MRGRKAHRTLTSGGPHDGLLYPGQSMTLYRNQSWPAFRRWAQLWARTRVLGFPVWQLVLVLCTLMISVQTVMVVRTINHHRSVLLMLADTTAAINRHSALEWQLISGAFLDKDLRHTFETSRATLQAFQTDLEHADQMRAGTVTSSSASPRSAASTETVVRLLTVLTRAIDREYSFVNQGDLVNARGVHDMLVSPTTAQLDQAISQTRASREQLSQHTLIQASMILVSMLLCFTLTVMVLSQRLLRDHQRAEQLERERQAEREREERDSLTGLWNRRGLQRQYTHLALGEEVVILMLDLNHLKAINDNGGHAAGDAHIRRVTTALLEATKSHDLVARWGGDEFVALLPKMTEAEAHRVAEQAMALLATPDNPLPFAYGLTSCYADRPLEQALTLADAAMYEHKEHQKRDPVNFGTGTRLGPTVEEFTVRLEQLETPHEVLQEGLTLARHLLGFNVSTYLERHGEVFVLRQLDGTVLEVTKAHFEGTRYQESSGVTARAVIQRTTVWSNDYPAEVDAIQAWLDLGLKSVIAVPVRYRGRVMGVITLMQMGSWRVITPQVRLLLEAVARRLGHTYEHAQAIEDVRNALQAGLFALGVALEERDLETSGHTERVVRLSTVLGSRLGWSGAKLEALRQGASLHDIGKLAIPDAVLLKPGALTPGEWAVMQKHTVRGYEIAQRLSGLMSTTLEVIHHHHEKWNGSGYPDRLAGEAIPLAARIFAVCDVYDALTHARPYKRAWSHQEALEEILAQRGIHFDPEVVGAFFTLDAESIVVPLDDSGALLIADLPNPAVTR